MCILLYSPTLKKTNPRFHPHSSLLKRHFFPFHPATDHLDPTVRIPRVNSAVSLCVTEGLVSEPGG